MKKKNLHTLNWKYVIIGAVIGLFVGILPFFSDITCGNMSLSHELRITCVKLFESPVFPILYFTKNILGLSGEQNLIALFIAPLVYISLGIVLGFISNKKNDNK